MPTEAYEEYPRESLRCCWPQEFTMRRGFSRQLENESYINWLQTDFGNDENEYEEKMASGNLDHFLVEFDGEPEQDREKAETRSGSQNNDGIEACNSHTNVRLFMQGMLRDESSLPYRDQVDTVATFCEQASLEIEPRLGHARKPVALLDDRSIGNSIVEGKERRCRPYLGPLTADQLRRELSKKRFKLEPAENALSKAFKDEETDAESRTIFVTNLDSWTINALAMTAPRSQASALKNLFYNYLTGRASIGVTIPSQGWLTFSLDFHIPYYVLRESNGAQQDIRKRADGMPLRNSWSFPFQPRSIRPPTSTDIPYSLHEAQISVAITGIDHWVWVAYGFVDTYFDSEESIDGYDRQISSSWNTDCRLPDCLMAGEVYPKDYIWTPRDYFLRILQIRIFKVLREWRLIIDKLQIEIERSRAIVFPLSSNDPKIRQELRDLSNWNRQMVKLVTQVISRLSDNIEAWDEFKGKDIGYFLDNDTRCHKPSINGIDKAFSQFKAVLLKLERLRKELCEDNPQGVHAHLSLENNEAAIVQRRTASHVEVLTVITIVFYPLAVSASLFSTQGVLPLIPNLARFTVVLLALAVLAAAISTILYNWTSCLQLIARTTRSSKSVWRLLAGVGKGDEEHHEFEDLEDFRETETSPTPKWSIFRRCLSSAHIKSRGDLEMGRENSSRGTSRFEKTVELPRRPFPASLESLPDSISLPIGSDHSPKIGQEETRSTRSGGLHINSMTVAKPSISTKIKRRPDSPSHRFRLSEMNEDLLHPEIFKAKLAGLQARVCRESGTAQQGLNLRRSDTETSITPDFLLQECQKFISWIQRNITVLQDAGFCTSTATFLQMDPHRTQVVFLRSVNLQRVAQLEKWIDKTKNSLDNLQRLDSVCKDILGDHLVSSTSLAAGNISIISLRILDLVLVSHVCSHMGDFGQLMGSDTSVGRKFQISGQTTNMIDTSASSEAVTITLSRRSLKCLNGFLCGKQVWVLHGPNADPKDSTELFLSTSPDVFADVWGPMWQISNAGKPVEILRYDLEHGSIVPFNLISGSRGHSVIVDPNEELCHWISESELEDLERALAGSSPSQIAHPRLLIGACRHSVTPNTEKCYCNMTDVYNRFVSSGYRRMPGSSNGKWVTESKTIGTTAGGVGLGAPTIQYSHTMKNDGTPVKEALYKRWKNNPRLRPWRLLLMRFGLQLSICNSNSRKVRLVDLIAGDTMIEFIKMNPAYAREPWREAFEKMLHTDPAGLVTFQAENPSEREAFDEYITNCLDGLIHTGIGARGQDPFVALWVHSGSSWEIVFPRHCHGWTGFVEDGDLTCSFIVLEKCLVNELGLNCCHPREAMSKDEIKGMKRDTPAVLETFLTISQTAGLPNGLRLRRRNGRQQWSVGALRNRKHSIKLGKKGILEGEGYCSKEVSRGGHSYSKKVLKGKWSSEGRMAATTRVLSAFITPPETHMEHIWDGSENELSPLPYHVLEET